MKLEGSLDAFSLPDIFQLLSFTKKSGGLRLSHAGADGVVYFADGFVTGASADGVRQALARRLIGSGAIDDDTLVQAVAAAETGRGIGPWLVEAGAVDLELVRQAATEQTMDSVFDLLRWPAGDFAFNVDAANPDDVGIRLAPDVVVAEAEPAPGCLGCRRFGHPGPGHRAHHAGGRRRRADGDPRRVGTACARRRPPSRRRPGRAHRQRPVRGRLDAVRARRARSPARQRRHRTTSPSSGVARRCSHPSRAQRPGPSSPTRLPSEALADEDVDADCRAAAGRRP